HGEFAVENSGTVGIMLPPSVLASMRPRRIRRGEGNTCNPDGKVVEWLQCGHGEFAVENSLSSETLCTQSKLQCGHGEFAVENQVCCTVKRQNLRLQCGHGEFAVENQMSWRNGSSKSRRFNAATANSPWRSGQRRSGRNRRKCFNAATANSPWRTTLLP